MGELLNIITPLHKKTHRDYIGRMQDQKVECMKVARRYDHDFWDGDRRYGYGGYKYDGRWAIVAQQLVQNYQLPSNAKILDVGCGKGYLLYEFQKLLPQTTLVGFDISRYAIENAPKDLKANLFVHTAQESYPFLDKEFDLIVSNTTLHNLKIFDLKIALML